MGNRKSKRSRKGEQTCCEGNEFCTLLFHQDDPEAVREYASGKFLSTHNVVTAFFPKQHKASKHRVYVLQSWLQHKMLVHICYSGACTRCHAWPRENGKHLIKEVLERMAFNNTFRPDHNIWEACALNMIDDKEERLHLSFDNAILICWCAAAWSSVFDEDLMVTLTHGSIENNVHVSRDSKYVWLAEKFIKEGPGIASVIATKHLDKIYKGLRRVVSAAAFLLCEYEEWPERSAWRIYKKFMFFVTTDADIGWMEEEEVNLYAKQQASPCGEGRRPGMNLPSMMEFSNSCGMIEI